jgi:aspartate aminotransferase
MHLAERVRSLELSVTLALDARAKDLRARGRDIVNMSVGEPDFPAPRVCQDAAVERVTSGDVKYTPAAGTTPLREAIARHLTRTRATPYAAREIAVCHSAKHALSGVLLAMVEHGDEVVVPLPAWVSYVEQIRIAEATPVLVPPAAGCRPDFTALEAAITPRSRVIMINSPCNPTGYVWTPDEIGRISKLAVRHDLWLLSDEIYRRLVYEGPPALSPASTGPAARARTAIVDGASKAFAMTGYRIGYVAGPEELTSAVVRLHSQMTGSPNAISQDAFEVALEREPPEVERMVQEFSRRRAVLLEGLRALGLVTPQPRGAFYAFPDVASYLDDRGSVGFCEDLLEAQGLAIVPGAAFGADRHVRLSYATDVATIQEAVRRLGAFLGAIRAQR